MPTLNHYILEENYNLTLFCHSSRMPDVGLVQKLAESLQLARKMVSDANVQLENVIEDSCENKFQPNPNPFGARPYKSKYPVAAEAAKYHLKLTEWASTDRVRVSKVMENTSRGLNGPIILSDVLGLYTVDLYKVYRGLDLQDAMRVQPGKYRKATAVDDKGVPEANLMEGYVKWTKELEGILKAFTSSSHSPVYIQGLRWPALSFTRRLTSSLAPWTSLTAVRDSIYKPASRKESVMPIATHTWYSLFTVIN
jgi:hypothetical protein